MAGGGWRRPRIARRFVRQCQRRLRRPCSFTSAAWASAGRDGWRRPAATKNCAQIRKTVPEAIVQAMQVQAVMAGGGGQELRADSQDSARGDCAGHAALRAPLGQVLAVMAGGVVPSAPAQRWFDLPAVAPQERKSCCDSTSVERQSCFVSTCLLSVSPGAKPSADHEAHLLNKKQN